MKWITLSLALSLAPCGAFANTFKDYTAPDIDPATRVLVEQLAQRYSGLKSFECQSKLWRSPVAESDEHTVKPRELQVKWESTAGFSICETQTQSQWTRRWVCDGVTITAFDSRYPHRYTRRRVKNSERKWKTSPGDAVRVVGVLAPAWATLDGFSVDAPFGIYLWQTMPLTAPESSDEKGVRFVYDDAMRRLTKSIFAIDFWVDPETTTLKRMVAVSDGQETTRQTFVETRFNPTFAPQTFRAIISPIDERVRSFDKPLR